MGLIDSGSQHPCVRRDGPENPVFISKITEQFNNA